MSERNLRRAADHMAAAIRQAKADLGLVACDNTCDDAPCELLRALADWEHQLSLPTPEAKDPGGSYLSQEDVAEIHREIEQRRQARAAQQQPEHAEDR